MAMCTETSSLSLIAESAGISYNLNDRARVRLKGYDGLGQTEKRRLSQKAPQQIGVTDLGFVQDARFLSLVFQINGRDLPDYYDLREQFEIIFRDRDDDPVKLTFGLPRERTRSLNVVTETKLDFPNERRNHSYSSFDILLKASDPRLFDPIQRTATFNLFPAALGITVPYFVPVSIGGGVINTTETITYASGSRLASPEFPIITITGPLVAPIIQNLTTGEDIDLTANGGLSIGAGEVVTIDLDGSPRRDSKTIIDQNGVSKQQFLSDDSSFATWHLSFAGERLSTNPNVYNETGDNIIRVTGSGANSNSSVTISYFDRYEGV